MTVGSPAAWVFHSRAVWSRLADPRLLSKLLPYALLIVLIVAVGLTARRLGGSIAMWAAAAMCFASYYPLYRMTGGLPRSFAMPLLAVAACALAPAEPPGHHWSVACRA